MLLENKIVVVTGNPYGIGRVSAELLSGEGARVVCIDDSKTGWHADKKTLERIDILVNLAGRASKKCFEETDEKTWNNMIARNLTATFLCSQKFLPLIKKSSTGVIVNHASIDAFL